VLLPEVLDDYVAAANPVRFLDAFVAQLDLGALGFQRAVPAETGRPGYDPGDLLRLYLYGYLHRLRSSRRLEQETHRNVELIWLLRRLTPDFKTIADFRRDHPEALKRVGREFILLCRRLRLFGGELLAIDGSKFRAVNARDRCFTPAKLVKLQREIDQTIARYLRDLEHQDRAEVGTEGPTAAGLQEKIAALRERQAQYAVWEQQLAASGATALSLTDPDSRPMMSAGLPVEPQEDWTQDVRHGEPHGVDGGGDPQHRAAYVPDGLARLRGIGRASSVARQEPGGEPVRGVERSGDEQAGAGEHPCLVTGERREPGKRRDHGRHGGAEADQHEQRRKRAAKERADRREQRRGGRQPPAGDTVHSVPGDLSLPSACSTTSAS